MSAVPAGSALVIGAGPGGASCASWLAQQGMEATVIEAAPQPMPLLRRLDLRQNWVLGAPDTSTARLGQQYADHLQALPLVRLLCGVTIASVEGLSHARKALRLSDGTTAAAQALVVATGLQPRQPPQALPPGESLLDAVGLTLARDRFAPARRVLLLGAGDNAAENAVHLAGRGHHVVLWSRSGWRAQTALRRAAGQAPGIELRLHVPLPTRIEREGSGWRVVSAAHGSESFDETAALFGFEPDARAWNQLRASEAWHASGWPDIPIGQADQLAGEGVFLAGDASQRLHPTIQTALADGVTAAKQVAHWLSQREPP